MCNENQSPTPADNENPAPQNKTGAPLPNGFPSAPEAAPLAPEMPGIQQYAMMPTPPNGVYMPPPPYYVPTPSPSTLAIRETAKLKKSMVLLLLGWIACYFYSDVMLMGSLSGLAVPMYMAVFYLLAFWYLAGKKGAFRPTSLLLLIPIALLSASYAFIDSILTNFITSLVLLVAVPLQLTVMAGGTKLSSPSAILDTLKTTVGNPFSNMGSTFHAFSGRKTKEKKQTNLLLILVGLLCSIPVVLIFFALFSGGDTVFRTVTETLLNQFDFSSLFFNLIAATILSLFVIPFFFSLRASKLPEEKDEKKKGSLPPALIVSFLFGIVLVEALFAGIQISYLFPGANDGLRLPEASSYAEFARSGFAQISAAAFLTALIIALVFLLCRKTEKGAVPVSVRLCVTLLACLDGVLCVSAYVRMFLYIEKSVYTVVRINTCWLMALTMLLVLGLLLKVWAPRMKLFAWTVTTVLMMTVLLNGMNPDRLVARLNVDRYIASGYSCRLEPDYFYALSPAALPEVQRLRDDEQAMRDEKLKSLLDGVISEKREELASRTWKNLVFSFEHSPAQ